MSDKFLLDSYEKCNCPLCELLKKERDARFYRMVEAAWEKIDAETNKMIAAALIAATKQDRS